MKRITVLLTAVLLALSLASCTLTGEASLKEEETKKSETTAREGFEDVTVPADTVPDTTKAEETTEKVGMTNEKAVETAKNYLGSEDAETGYKYAYSFDEKMTDNGTEYWKVRVAWYLEEEERYATCGYLLIDEAGNVTKFDW